MEEEREKEVRIVYTVPNQRVVETMKAECNGRCKENYFTECNLNSLRKALKELSPNAFKLYMYFAKNQDGYTFALSRADVMNATNISASTYTRAINEMMEKGYLVQSKGRFYEFHDWGSDEE